MAKTVAAADYPWIGSYPDHVSWDAEIFPQTLPEMFDASVARYAERPCTYFLGASMSYGEIGALTQRVAAGLHASGIAAGTRVGLLLPNCPYFIAFYFAALKLGCVVVNYNPLYTVDELAHQVRDSGTELMITLDLKVLFGKVEELVVNGALERVVACPFADLLPGVKSILFRLLKGRERAAPRSSRAAHALLDYAQLLAHGTTCPARDIDPKTEVALLQYTGGTTGTPKGAMLTHGNLTANVQQVTMWFPDLDPDGEIMMGILPFFHVFAMTGIMNFGLSRGLEMVLMPRFDLDEAITLIRRRRPSILPGVPTLFNAIMNHKTVTAEDLASIKYCISGGAPLPLEVKTGFEALANCAVVEGYGLSETSPVATINPIGGAVKANSIGQPLPRTVVSIRALDDPKRELGLGEDGEVCIAGPQVMQGYWNKPQETRATFVDEYLRTGDVGHLDEDGFVFLIDRIKDIIICSGFNVYPRRIEDAIYEFPAVEECTVIGIANEYRGEAPKAFVKLKPDVRASEAEILGFLETKLSVIEMPEAIEFRDELPKTMVGKLSKKELR
jgi:long-chain acyl-CoA synthetase